MSQPPQGGSPWEKQSDPGGSEPTQIAGRPQFDKPQNDTPQFDKPQFDKPQDANGQPQYGQPGYSTPQYGQPGPPAAPGYGAPQQYAPPAYSQPQYGQQQYQPVPAGYYPVFNSQGQQVLVPLATPGKRLLTLILDGLLYIGTLVIGYIIWILITWGDGQTPGKKLTKLKYVNTQTGQVADWGKSAFRDFIIFRLLFNIIAVFTLTIGWFVGAFMIFDKDKNHQAGWDRIAGTVVVDVSNVQL